MFFKTLLHAILAPGGSCVIDALDLRIGRRDWHVLVVSWLWLDVWYFSKSCLAGKVVIIITLYHKQTTQLKVPVNLI